MEPGARWRDLARPPLDQRGLQASLTSGPRPAWRALEVVAETGSTNADLVQRAADGEPSGLVLVADHQSAGRGRLARQWTAPPRSSLAVSVLLRPTAPARRWAWLGLLAGLAAVDALTRTCGLPARLKWPNDVLVPDGGDPGSSTWRKVCGILAEAQHGVSGTPGAVVLGAGVNVSQAEHELPVATATSLLVAGSASTDRDTVLRAYLRALAQRYTAWEQADGDPARSGTGPAYREACLTLGLHVQVALPSGEVVSGVAEGVDDEGRLVVRGASGQMQALAAGDVVHVRAPEGPGHGRPPGDADAVGPPKEA